MAIQVQEATKDGQGKSLSILRRQFISFSYGGRNIEDFDLLAVFNNDRFTKEIYSPFTDTTTELTDLDGQIFWKSKYKPTILSFTLATDGITAKQYEDFKKWFIPGETKKLILSEYHNRYAYARVSSAPVISLLPFEKEISIKVNNSLMKTKSTLYKGEIDIEFVLDDPYWYSINSFLTSTTEEDIKILYEDGIPYQNMFIEEGTYFLANNQIVSIGTGEKNYLYNCGSAAAKPIITLTFNLQKEEEANQFSIKIGKNELKIGAPSFLTSYYQAVKIISDGGYTSGKSAISLSSEIRSNISHPITRAKIIDCINKNTNEGKLTEGFMTAFDGLINIFLITVSLNINIKTGEVILTYTLDGQERTEDAGNMIQSPYFSIEGGCRPDINGQIKASDCLEVISSGINISEINFEYTYL